MSRAVRTAAVGALLVAALTAGVPAAAGVRESPSRPGYGQARLQHDLDAIRDAGVPGVLAEVHLGDRVLRGTSGVADLATGRGVPANGYFRMGSNTKTFVAVVVLQLVGERRLALEDPVERWLPGVVRGNGHDGRNITVRQLLNHTSGVFDVDEDIIAMVPTAEAFQEHRFDTFTLPELVSMAMRHAPYFAPGTGWHYSNTNYALAGMIINRVTGRGWADEVTDRVLRPLGLRHTFEPGQRPELPEPHATGYSYDYDPAHPLDVTSMNMSWAEADGSLVTNAADLSRFWRAIGRGELLAPRQRSEMRTTVVADDEFPGARYGLGIYRAPLTCGGGFWTHPGGVPGFTTMNGVGDDGRTTVVISLSTAASRSAMELALGLVDGVMCAHGRASGQRAQVATAA